MAHYKLGATLVALTKDLDRMERLASAAQQWAYMTPPSGMPKFTLYYLELVTEMAFLRAFSAWEAFLEESFILYLWGKDSPIGKGPVRHAHPPSRKVAENLMVESPRGYADWSDANNVIRRAERFFADGKPYSNALRSQQSQLQDIKILRNAIAHSSSYSWEKYQSLVRRELVTYPPGLKIGGFLSMTKPGSSPPSSFLESHLTIFRFLADRIVPR